MVLLQTASPLFLSFIQFLTGAALVYLFLSRTKTLTSTTQSNSNNLSVDTIMKMGARQSSSRLQNVSRKVRLLLAKVSMCYCGGFTLTNMSFNTIAPASFVETIKASEPLTSAMCSYIFNVDSVSYNETASLMLIVGGIGLVIVSRGGGGGGGDIWTVAMVFCSNLAFSMRSMFQTKMRAKKKNSTGTSKDKNSNEMGQGQGQGQVQTETETETDEFKYQQLDDWNLFFRVQQFGVMAIFPLMIIFEGMSFAKFAYHAATGTGTLGLNECMILCGLIIVNAICYTIYQVASTTVLTEVSMIEHAALNAMRRLFAICATSVIFGTTISREGVCGILLTLVGFLLFVKFKSAKRKMLAKGFKGGKGGRGVNGSGNV